MNWRVKGIVQKALSAVPCGVRANDLLQRRLGGLRDFDRHVAAKVGDWTALVGELAGLGVGPRGLRLVEVGTGWFPTLPVCFALAGATGCDTYDLRPHLCPRLTARLLAALQRHLPTIAAAARLPSGEVEQAYHDLARPASLAELLARARVRYHAPADAARTGLPDGGTDVVFSNSVLEHVPAAAIGDVLGEAARVLRPGGVTIHSVNCGDHYAYFDRRITPINYLAYSGAQWRRWNNDLQYQNRLRPVDFTTMAERAGLTVALNRYRPRADLRAALAGLRVADEFRRYPAEQLCTTSVTFAGRKVEPPVAGARAAGAPRPAAGTAQAVGSP